MEGKRYYCGFLCGNESENENMIKHLRKFRNDVERMDQISEQINTNGNYNALEVETKYEGIYHKDTFEQDRAGCLLHATDPYSYYYDYQVAIFFNKEMDRELWYQTGIYDNYTMTFQFKYDKDLDACVLFVDFNIPKDTKNKFEQNYSAKEIKKRFVFSKRHIKVLEKNRIFFYFDATVVTSGIEVNWINPIDPIVITYLNDYAVVHKIKSVNEFFTCLPHTLDTETEFDDRIEDPENADDINDDVLVDEEILEPSKDIVQLALLKRTEEKGVFAPSVITVNRYAKYDQSVFPNIRDDKECYVDNKTLKFKDDKISWDITRPNTSKYRKEKEIEKSLFIDIPELERIKDESIQKYLETGKGAYLRKVTSDQFFISSKNRKGDSCEYFKFIDYHTGKNKKIQYRPIETIKRVRGMLEDIENMKIGQSSGEKKQYSFGMIRYKKDIPMKIKYTDHRDVGTHLRRDIDRLPGDPKSEFNPLVYKEIKFTFTSDTMFIIIREVNHANFEKKYTVPIKDIEVKPTSLLLVCDRLRIYEVEDKEKHVHAMKMDLFYLPDVLDGTYKLI